MQAAVSEAALVHDGLSGKARHGTAIASVACPIGTSQGPPQQVHGLISGSGRFAEIQLRVLDDGS